MPIVLGVLAALFAAGAANFWLVGNNTSAALACLGIAVVATVGVVIALALEQIAAALNDIHTQLSPSQRTGGRSGHERRAR